MSVFALGCLITNLAGGRAVDRHGARPVVVAGWGVAALGELGLAAVSEAPALLGVSLVMGCGVGAAYPATRALLGEVTSPANRSLVFGAQHGLLNVALSVGVVLAALVLASATLGRYQLLYVADAASFLAAAALLSRHRPGATATPDSAEDRNHATSAGQGRYRRLLRDRVFLRVCAMQAFIVTFGYAQANTALPMFLSRPGGIPAWAIAAVFAVNTTFVALAALRSPPSPRGLRAASCSPAAPAASRSRGSSSRPRC